MTYGADVGMNGRGAAPHESESIRPGDRVLEDLRVLVVAGVPVGVLVIGVCSRLAMLLLRLTSPDHVNGVRSDDDFVIGRFTLSGSYNLLMLGAAVGIVGAGLYRLVSRWLLGPTWFRHVTTALASGAVGGSILVHADGVDYRLLKPTWLAIALFVFLPALFGGLIGVVVDRVARPDSWTRVGRRRWALPFAALLPFPLAVIPLLLAIGVVAPLVAIGEADSINRLRASNGYAFVVRGVWLGIAVLGLFILIEDVIEIRRVV